MVENIKDLDLVFEELQPFILLTSVFKEASSSK